VRESGYLNEVYFCEGLITFWFLDIKNRNDLLLATDHSEREEEEDTFS